jgi:hypothetical protein
MDCELLFFKSPKMPKDRFNKLLVAYKSKTGYPYLKGELIGV